MATRVVMPSLGMYTAEASVAGWLAPPGSSVAAGEPLVELASDKTSFELDSPASGRFHPVVELGAVVQVEGLIALLLEPGESVEAALAGASRAPSPAVEPAPPVSAPAAVAAQRPESRERVAVSPLARRLAEELGVDLAAVSGSGPNGRIVEADVRAAGSARRGARP